MHISEKKMGEGQGYEARGVVARYHQMGHFQANHAAIRVPVYRFLTLYRGESSEAIPVEYVRPAPVIEENGEYFVNIEALEVGDIVVNPALVYRKCLWFPNLMDAHMRASATYKPKTITVAEKDDAPAFDLGILDKTTDQVTKQ